MEHLRTSFTLARGALRLLLARAAGEPAAALRFTYGEKGKPSLAAAGRIRFNLSHSGGLALVAITLDCELGVDIEKIRPMPDLQDVARRFFSIREAAFFRCWTRKEAYIKTIGDGLSAPLDGFAVSLRPDEPARLIHLNGDAAAARAWSLHDLEIDPGYAAALAYRDARREVRLAPPVDPAHLLD